ncbi:adenosylcobinamide-phosphate synthase CbiB [Haloferacaceae archaeon DSL9]
MGIAAAVAITIGFALDRLFAEPPTRLHPVGWLGRLIEPVDRDWSRPRLVGALAALALPALAGGVAFAAVAGAALVHPIAGPVVAGAVLFATTSLRMLVDTARRVVELAETDLDRAREELLALAGRDASHLSPGAVRSAAVESAAENLADGLVGSLAAFAIAVVAFGVVTPAWALSFGAAAAAWVKAVNTMDSMLGYRTKPVGWASARLDDLVMWLPARASAAMLSLAAGTPDPLLQARRWAQIPPSPNSGWPMATVAAALHVRLEKPGVYTLNDVASLPTETEATRGVALVERAGIVAVVCAVVVVLV